MTGQRGSPGRVFISYSHEDSSEVDWLQAKLEAADISVWRDKDMLRPGDEWHEKIRHAIADDALVFLACFSSRSLARIRSRQNEELTLAVEERRLRPAGRPWLIPVKFDECDIPDISLGGGMTLRSIQSGDLSGPDADSQADQLVNAINSILTRTPDNAGKVLTRSNVDSLGDQARPATENAGAGRGWRSRSGRLMIAIAATAVIAAATVLTLRAFQSPARAHPSPGTRPGHPSPFLAARLTDPEPNGPVALAFSPDGSTLAVAGTNSNNNKGDTYEWSLSTHLITATLHDPHSTGAFDVAYNPSGTILAVADHNGSTCLWDVATSAIIATLHEPRRNPVLALAFSPGGTTLATGDRSGSTYLWNLTSHAITAALSGPATIQVDSLAFMPGGTTLAVGGTDGSIHLWNLASHIVTAVLYDPDNTNPSHGGARSLAFFNDGHTLADSDGNGHTYLWNISRRAISETLAAPAGQEANAVALNPAGTLLATGDFNDHHFLNDHAYLWDLITHRLLAALPSEYPVYDVAINPAGTILAAVDGQRVDLWEGL